MTPAARRYGGALYDLAAGEGLGSRLLAEVELAAALFAAEPRYRRLLEGAGLGRAGRAALLDAAFGAVCHPYLVNFLKVLGDAGLLGELDGCARAYRDAYNRANGILPVRAVAAAPLTAAQRRRLTERLARRTGRTVQLEVTVDPALLTGLCLDFAGHRLDGTGAARLRRFGGKETVGQKPGKYRNRQL